MTAEDRALAMRLLEAARPIARAHFRAPLAVERKADLSPVTIADRAIEAAMRGILAAERPGDGIFGEEFGSEGVSARRLWVLDPIDGTKSFISGTPLFGTLIALLEDGVPVLGLIDMPILGETWVGAAGAPSTLNGAPAKTREAQTGEARTGEAWAGEARGLADAVLFATSPDQFAGADAARFEALSAACAARRFGGDCYSYGLLASGHVELILEAGLEPYDFLALVPVVEGAGGVITDWDGAPLGLGSEGRVLAAADPALHRAALAALHDAG